MLKSSVTVQPPCDVGFAIGGGYCERLRVGERSSGIVFLLPDLQRYPVVAHSYIVELKYLKADAARQEADAQ